MGYIYIVVPVFYHVLSKGKSARYANTKQGYKLWILVYGETVLSSDTFWNY